MPRDIASDVGGGSATPDGPVDGTAAAASAADAVPVPVPVPVYAAADGQVLVVGAGPVGLTAAHELARRGLAVRLIDAASRPARTSRAVAVHPRTLETFDQMGVIGPVLEHGRRNRAFTMYGSGRRLVRLEADYASMPTRYPYTVIIEQTRTEAVLREAVARLGVQVEWGVRLVSFEQSPSGVRAVLAHADGREERHVTGWLVGCDGGHSTVRKQLRLPLIGESSETWELADAPVDVDLPPDTIYWAHTGGQALMMVPYPEQGRWRLLDTAPTGPGADPRPVAERFSAKLSAGLGTEVRVGEPTWTSLFTFQQRMVPRMHDGRCFVAGDAAHVHSPASGQGMNTGVQEAYNLAWKLAMAAHGWAGRELLHTYGEERVPVGQALLGSTKQATFLVQFKNTLAGLALPVVMGVVRNVGPLRRAIQRKVLGGMSGLRLGYPESSLTTPVAGMGLPAGSRAAVAVAAAATAARHVDDAGAAALRAELRDVRWSLLYVPEGTGEAADTAAGAGARHEAWLSVRTVTGAVGGGEGRGGEGGPRALADPDGLLRRALGLSAGGWLLIRPDGYVASGGTELTEDALARALAPLGVAAREETRPVRREPAGERSRPSPSSPSSRTSPSSPSSQPSSSAGASTAASPAAAAPAAAAPAAAAPAAAAPAAAAPAAAAPAAAAPPAAAPAAAAPAAAAPAAAAPPAAAPAAAAPARRRRARRTSPHPSSGVPRVGSGTVEGPTRSMEGAR
ncbi:FAD-dependent oxidoreductase [Streptomyces sp. NPDC090022]|uniref:FAD-dependent oxidoreductase n=1 Tax=Streptomyces sp. NPDC090022 TaxID=3365920 RepID=UPI00380EF01A